MYNVIMQYSNSFLSCSVRNLTLASLSLLFAIKIDVFPNFKNFYSHSGIFPRKQLLKINCMIFSN